MLGDSIAALGGVKSSLRRMTGGKGGPKFVIFVRAGHGALQVAQVGKLRGAQAQARARRRASAQASTRRRRTSPLGTPRQQARAACRVGLTFLCGDANARHVAHGTGVAVPGTALRSPLHFRSTGILCRKRTAGAGTASNTARSTQVATARLAWVAVRAGRGCRLPRRSGRGGQLASLTARVSTCGKARERRLQNEVRSLTAALQEARPATSRVVPGFMEARKG